jgi:hypothetical protein
MPSKTNNKSSKYISISNPTRSKNIQGTSHTTATTYQPPSMMDNIKSGFGLGIGSSIGARITDSIFGNRTVNVFNKSESEPVTETIPEISSLPNTSSSNTDTDTTINCHHIIDEYRFNNCIMYRNNDNDTCNRLYDKFFSCQKNLHNQKIMIN